jgi:hypothetical protein
MGSRASVGTLKIEYLHTSSKLRQGVGRASTYYHVSYSFGPHLPAEVGFRAATCLTASNLTSLLR